MIYDDLLHSNISLTSLTLFSRIVFLFKIGKSCSIQNSGVPWAISYKQKTCRLFDFHIAYFEGEIANRKIHLSIGGFHLVQEYGLNTTIRVCLESRSIQRLIIIFPMIKHNNELLMVNLISHFRLHCLDIRIFISIYTRGIDT